MDFPKERQELYTFNGIACIWRTVQVQRTGSRRHSSGNLGDFKEQLRPRQ